MIVPEDQIRPEELNKRYAAVCGLYCRACRWFIATAEDPEMLKAFADQMHFTPEEARCKGCRSDQRLVYCATCKMAACAADRNIDFCSECDAYPCDELRQFQSAMPHRAELWDNLERIKTAGYQQWMKEIRQHYACPNCQTINGAYDLQCRKCGADPSCRFAAAHREAIEAFIKGRQVK